MFIQTIENIFGTSWSVFHICIPKHIIIEDICFSAVECIIKVSCSLSLLNVAWNILFSRVFSLFTVLFFDHCAFCIMLCSTLHFLNENNN